MSFEALNIPKNVDKETVFDAVESYLNGYEIEFNDVDNERPWGGFFVIAKTSIDKFIDTFYPELNKDEIFKYGKAVQPKILIVMPGAELSWQKHFRRAELWKAVEGPVGFKESLTDDLPEEVKTLNTGELVQHDAETRHRLIGLGKVGVVAEIWQHTVEGNPSDEDDIVRLADMYGRG